MLILNVRHTDVFSNYWWWECFIKFCFVLLVHFTGLFLEHETKYYLWEDLSFQVEILFNKIFKHIQVKTDIIPYIQITLEHYNAVQFLTAEINLLKQQSLNFKPQCLTALLRNLWFKWCSWHGEMDEKWRQYLPLI